MGCFNIHGFYSHLPIKYGDRVGAIICAKQDTRYNLALETVHNGIIPIMAPVYGTYDDYGNAENLDYSASAVAFEKLTGESLVTFMDCIGRNGSTSINTKDNGNDYDDIPGFQNVIKHLIPKYHGDLYCEEYDKFIKDAEDRGDNYVAEQYKGIKTYDQLQRDLLRNATFLVLYEHESVLKELARIGSSYMNGIISWNGEKRDASSSYDVIANYVDIVEGSIFSIFEASSKISNKLMDILNDLKDGKYSEEEKTSALNDVEIIKSMTYESNALCAERDLLPDYITHTDYFGAVYKNQHVDHAAVKNEILDLLYINNGLHWLGGTYTINTYAGQEINIDEIESMHQVITNLVNIIKNNENSESDVDNE